SCAPMVIASAAARTRLHLSRGEVGEAVTAANAGALLARKKGVWAWAAELMPVATEAYARAGDLASAQALVEAYDSGIVGRSAPRCQHALRGHGTVVRSRRGRRGYGDELSPREKDVARLLARGHSNREIAEVLFLSPRTVEHHVARVLQKSGARSRVDLRES